jgi:integrative and conjugative element protein (TIGR02256 family)
MVPNEFWSDDCRFGLLLADCHMEEVLDLCKKAGDMETGGILVGYYTSAHDCAIVTGVSAAPTDSHRGRSTFSRGKAGLQVWLVRLWRDVRHYYLGEWHYHPGGGPAPSDRDVQQMRDISSRRSYRCPEPVLFIVGGDAQKFVTAAFVFPYRQERVDLRPAHSNGGCPRKG